jgi:hypothetical protein
MVEQASPGSGSPRKIIEYRSIITLGNLLSILTIIVSLGGGLIWWYGDVQSRLATLEIKMEFAQDALSAMARKLGVEITVSEAASSFKIHRTR